MIREETASRRQRATGRMGETECGPTPVGRRDLVPAACRRLALGLLLVFVSAEAFAETKPTTPLTGKLELRHRRCRSGSPIPVVWKLDWNEQAIADGVLEFEIYEGNELLGRFRIPDVVLSQGANEFNAVLPALSVHSSSAATTIQARFTTGTRTIDLEEQTLRIPSQYIQWFSVGVVSGAIANPSDTETKLFEKIRLESFLPREDAESQSATSVFELRPNNLPADPLSLCDFDVVALSPQGLSELRDDQIDALKKWVTAGGSLCVIAGGGLAPKHAHFLDELFAESPGHETFLVDSRGFLQPGEEAAGEIVSARKGLGRVVALRRPLLKTLAPDEKPWRNAVAFLLKVRKDQYQVSKDLPSFNAVAGQAIDALKEALVPPQQPAMTLQPSRPAQRGQRPQPPTTQRLTPQQQQRQMQLQQQARIRQQQRQQMQQAAQQRQFARMNPQAYNPAYVLGSPLSPPPLEDRGGLFQLLMPQDVQMVPLGVIAGVLIAYVLAIGPVDYFLLGFLRLRRFTWVLFPAVTVGFAAATLWLAQWYLGTNDSRRAIEFFDVVKGGVVARHTRVELLFLSQQRDTVNDLQNGLFTHVGLMESQKMSDPLMPTPMGDALAKATVFEGRYPGRYAVVQTVPQWTPVVNRVSWIDPKPVEIETSPESPPTEKFDWDHLGDVDSAAGRQKLAERVRRAFGEQATAAVYRQAARIEILDSINKLQPLKIDPQQKRIAYTSADEVIHELSVRNATRLFGVASQVSPSGGPDLEDLSLIDSSDPRQLLLVIALKKGPDFLIYRRLFAGEP